MAMKDRTCWADGCDRPAFCKGLCTAHDQRARANNGDPLAHIPIRERQGICTVPGCGRKSRNLGVCNAHYLRSRNHDGDVQADKPVQDPTAPVWLRMDQNTDRSGGWTACWPWTGGDLPDDRYGGLVIDGQRLWAHRLAYELAYGPIDDGLSACHTCDNPPCCNPAHIWIGSHADNMADRDRKGRAGRLVGEANRSAIVSESDVLEMRRLYAARLCTRQELADQFGLSVSATNKIVYRHSWKHLP